MPSTLKAKEFSTSIGDTFFRILRNPHLVWDNVLTRRDLCVEKTIEVHEERTDFYVKTTGTVDCSVSMLYDIIRHHEETGEWQDSCLEARTIEKIDDERDICYLKYGIGFPNMGLDFCLFRCCQVIQENKEYMVAFRTIDHPHVPPTEGITRMDNPISGFWLRSCPEDPNKSIIVFLSNEHFQDNDMVKGRSLFLARTIYMIKRYVGNSQLDISTQYLNRLTDKMFKVVYGMFLPNLDWPVAYKGEGMSVHFKETPSRTVLAVTGMTVVENTPPKAILDALSHTNFDPLLLQYDVIEEIDSNNQIIYFSWKSMIFPGEMDAVIFQSKNEYPDDSCVALYQTVVHNKVPVRSDRHRIEFLPCAFFLHTKGDSGGTVICFCIQQDVTPYLSMGTKEGLLHIGILRHLALVANIKAEAARLSTTKKETTHASPPSITAKKNRQKIEFVTKLCSSLLSDDEKEHLLNQLHSSRSISPSTIVDFRHKRTSGYRLISRNRGYSNSKFLAELASTFQKDSEANDEDDVSILVTNNVQIDSSSKSTIEFLANELLLNIFVFLDYISLCRIAQVSRRFRDMTDTDPLWERLYCITWSIKKRPQVQFDWKDTFRAKLTLLKNWQHGKFTEKSIQVHDKPIKDMIVESDILITGSSDNTVKISDAKTGITVKKLEGPTAGVLSLNLDCEQLIVGYENSILKSWDFKSLEPLWERQFTFVSKGFRSLAPLLISWDSSIDVWDAFNGSHKYSFREHSKKITVVEVNTEIRNILVSGSSDCSVRRYDLTAGKVVNTLVGHVSRVNSVAFDRDFIVSGGKDSVVCLWDIRTEKPVTFTGNTQGVKSVAFDDQRIVSGNSEGIYVWDRRTNNMMLKIEQTGALEMLRLDEHKIVSCYADGTLRVYDFL